MRRKLLTGVCVVMFGISGMAYSDDTTVTLDGNASNSGFSIKDSSGTSIARFQGDGKVGIGTTSPDKLLTVNDSGGSNTQVAKFADNTRYIGLGRDEIAAFDLSGNLANFYLGGSGKLTISTSGNVGIGTTNPGALLHVNGDIWGTRFTDISNGSYYVDPYGDGGVSAILNGSVGIGTTAPSAVLDVAGGTIIRGSAGSGNIINLAPHDGNVGLELISGTSNGTPYIDFINDATSDFDMRIILSGDDTLAIEGGSLSYTSDVRLKRNVTILEGAVEKIRSIRGVSFEWKDEKYGKGTQIGLIAQDVEKTLPELVHTNTDGYKSVTYDKLTAVLVEAVKEQQGTIAAQNEKIAMLEKKLSELSETMNNVIQLASVK